MTSRLERLRDPVLDHFMYWSLIFAITRTILHLNVSVSVVYLHTLRYVSPQKNYSELSNHGMVMVTSPFRKITSSPIDPSIIPSFHALYDM